ncbi:MAG: hypothetical protein P4M02_07470, partial [Clostridia bacterium]|nr:hypothetical protein [Clostridia bacterium]
GLFVKELCAEGAAMRALLASILSLYGCERFRVFLPPDARDIPGASLVRAAMIRVAGEMDGHIARIIDHNKLYINMMLD